MRRRERVFGRVTCDMALAIERIETEKFEKFALHVTLETWKNKNVEKKKEETEETVNNQITVKMTLAKKKKKRMKSDNFIFGARQRRRFQFFFSNSLPETKIETKKLQSENR